MTIIANDTIKSMYRIEYRLGPTAKWSPLEYDRNGYVLDHASLNITKAVMKMRLETKRQELGPDVEMRIVQCRYYVEESVVED